MTFAHSVNPHIYDSSFTDIRGDLNIHHHHGDTYSTQRMSISQSETELLQLLQVASTGAAYDSQERYPPPRCHPETRTQVLDDIRSWMDWGKSNGQSVCWLHGPAGAGKSAIAQTVSEIYAQRGQLAASFFFSRSIPGRDSITYLFPTIALQIALASQDKRKKIKKIFADDPLIIYRDTYSHLKLIVKMFEHRSSGTGNAPSLVVIDGLDECTGNSNQSLILSHISNLVSTYNIPLRFLIVSRPEPHIRHCYKSPILSSVGTEISLYGNFQAETDVYAFLRNEFEKIHNSEKHEDIMKFVPKPWPSDDIVRLLAQRSGGYFIYASTVLKYVDEEYFSCIDRLCDVLNASSSGSAAFAELDKLYLQVLSTCPNTSLLTRILGTLWVPTVYPIETACEIEAVLGLRPGEVMLTLRGLHSILQFTAIDENIRIRSTHASFRDFLFDKDRAGKYFINSQACLTDLVRGCLALIGDWDKRGGRFAFDVFFEIIGVKFTLWYEELDQDWVVEHLASSVRAGGWTRFMVDSGDLNMNEKIMIGRILTGVLRKFQSQPSPPQDLIDEVLGLCNSALRSHISAMSLAESQCTHDLCSVLSFNEDPLVYPPFTYFVELLRLPGFLIPIYHYLGEIPQKVLVNFMKDPARCGVLYSARPASNARLAHNCINLLWRGVSRSTGYKYAKKNWARHLSLSPPGDKKIISHLKPFSSNLGAGYWLVPSASYSEDDLTNGTLVVEWLRRCSDMHNDLLLRWERHTQLAMQFRDNSSINHR